MIEDPTRRSFLKGLLGVGLVATMPSIVLPYERKRVYSFGTPPRVWVDPVTQLLHCRDGPRLSVLEFHREVYDYMQRPEMLVYPSAMGRNTDHMFDLVNGYSLAPGTERYLHSGSIRRYDELWTDWVDFHPGVEVGTPYQWRSAAS
jgi:hypothetical protein